MRSRVYDDGFSQSQRADESVLRAGRCGAREGRVGRVASPAYERFGERMFCRHRDLARSGPTGGLIWRDFVCGTFFRNKTPVIVMHWGVVSVSARGDRSAGNLINTHQGSEGHTGSRLPTVCSRGCGCLGFCGSNHTCRQHGVPAPHAVATELLRCLDETARGLAHVSAEQAVEVVYDECADHLWRCVEMWARWTVGMQGTCRGHAGRGERARACGRSRGV